MILKFYNPILLYYLLDELKSDELLEMRKRATTKGRRQAIFQEYQFGFQLEDIFNNNLSSIAKNLNGDERSPGKTSFQFNNIRSGLLDEMDQVKGMINSHRNSQIGLKSAENLQDNLSEISKEKKNQKSLNNSLNISNSNSQTQNQLIDLSVKGISPRKSTKGQQEEKILFKSPRFNQQQNQSEQKQDENIDPANLNDYLNKEIVMKGNNIKKGLRHLFILYKKFKGNFYSVQIEKFYIPVYTQIVDNLELIQDFHCWIDYLSRWMKMRGKQIENIFTSNGFRIMNLNQIQNSENILIIQDEDEVLSFWHDFQIYHNVQLTTQEQRTFVDYLNSLQTREEIYKTLVSQSLINKITQGQNADQSHNVSVNSYKAAQVKEFTLPSINTKQNYKDNLNESSINSINSIQKRKQNQDNSKIIIKSNSTLDLKSQRQQIQKERSELLDMFQLYENVMISSLGKKIKYPNKNSSISQGAILKQFNGVKMKVLQQSFPYLAQKKYVESRLQNSSYKPQMLFEIQQNTIVPQL